jgi:hypothetical protein
VLASFPHLRAGTRCVWHSGKASISGKLDEGQVTKAKEDGQGVGAESSRKNITGWSAPEQMGSPAWAELECTRQVYQREDRESQAREVTVSHTGGTS